jgi:uncharacterized protein
MRGPVPFFVDSGGWIALAVEGDPYHARARERWDELTSLGGKRYTSVPVVMETFTFLDRNTDRPTALLWKREVFKLPRLTILECTFRDLERAWKWFDRKELHKLSAVDATSFTLMERHRISHAFAFDVHFSVAGFKVL